MKKLTIIGEQEEELKCDEYESGDEQSPGKDDFSPMSPDLGGKTLDGFEINPEKTPTADDGVDQGGDTKLSQRQKKHKSKQIKKILKERLNIDCLRMLCEEDISPEEDGPGDRKANVKGKAHIMNSSNNMNDSYHVLMREIGVEHNDGLSQAFLNKNGEAQREKLNSFTEMFSVRDLLGVGAFGVVLLVKNRITKEKSALKIVAKESLSERAQKILKNESTIMQTMDHESVVSLKRIFENSKFIILEMELIPGGQLKRLMKLKDDKGQPKALSDLEASKVMKSLLNGVAYVHARDIIHRDLKPENILLSTTDNGCFDVKIVDFGLSAEQNFKNKATERAGTPIYMAPEQVTGKGYSKKIDIWACGIIAYQLLTAGQHPCYQSGQNYYKKLQNIESDPIEFNFPETFTPLAKDFFQNLCRYPSTQRYDAVTALQHPWITRNVKDQIPLNQVQEMEQFQQERQLRKVMAIAFFTSLVKMSSSSQSTCQSSVKDTVNGNDSGSETTSVAQDQSRLTPMRRNTQPTSYISFNSTMFAAYSKDKTTTPLRLQEKEQSTRDKISLTKQDSDQVSIKYDHDSFLEPGTFESYKQLIFRASKPNPKTTMDSTSAESPILFMSIDDKANGAHGSKDSLETYQDSKINSRQSKNNNGGKSGGSSSPLKRGRMGRKHKQQISQKQSSFLSTQNETMANFSAQMTQTQYNQNQQSNSLQQISEAAAKRKIAQINFAKTAHQNMSAEAAPPSTSLSQQQQNLSRLAKQNSIVSQRGTDNSLINNNDMQSVSFTQQNYFKNNGQSQRPGRNLVPVKSPLSNPALKDWEQASLVLREDINGGPVQPNSGSFPSRKSKLLNKAAANNKLTVNSIDPDCKSSKLAFAGQQSLSNRKKSDHQLGQSLFIKDQLNGATMALRDTNRTSDNMLTYEVRERKNTDSGISLHQVSPRQKLCITSVAQKLVRPKEDDNSPVLIQGGQAYANETPIKIKNPQTYDENYEYSNTKYSRQGVLSCHYRQSPSVLEPQQSHGLQADNSFFDSPVKKQVTSKSTKKRTSKKLKSTDKNSRHNGVGGPKSLQRQTTFDAHSQNNNVVAAKGLHESMHIIGGIDQKIDWLKLAKDERTIGGSKLLQSSQEPQSHAFSAIKTNRAGQNNYQDFYLYRQSQQPIVYQPPINQPEAAKTQYKSFKGVRKTAKSPLLPPKHHQSLAAAGNNSGGSSLAGQMMSAERPRQQQSTAGGAMLTGQGHISTMQSQMATSLMHAQLGQSPEVNHRMPHKLKVKTKSKTSAKKLPDEQVSTSPLIRTTSNNGMVSSSTEHVQKFWKQSVMNSKVGGTFNEDSNVPLRSFGGEYQLESAYQGIKHNSRTALHQILNGSQISTSSTKQQHQQMKPKDQAADTRNIISNNANSEVYERMHIRIRPSLPTSSGQTMVGAGLLTQSQEMAMQNSRQQQHSTFDQRQQAD